MGIKSMNCTRRNFLIGGSTTLFLTGFLSKQSFGNIKKNNLVIISLRGGMDGLTAVPVLGDKRLKKLRREQENYTYRDLKYNFFTAYDILEKDITNIKEGYKFYQNFYQTLIEYDEYYGYSKPLTHFLSAYNQEIVRIAQILNFDEIIDFLLLFDSDNQHIYQQYYEN